MNAISDDLRGDTLVLIHFLADSKNNLNVFDSHSSNRSIREIPYYSAPLGLWRPKSVNVPLKATEQNLPLVFMLYQAVAIVESMVFSRKKRYLYFLFKGLKCIITTKPIMVCKCCNLKVESDCESQVLFTCTASKVNKLKNALKRFFQKAKFQMERCTGG